MRPGGPVRALRFPAILALATMALALAASGLVLADPEFPALAGRVVDGADILAAADETELAAELEALEARTSDQLVIVTLPSLQGYPIEEFGYRLGRHWGIGRQGRDNGVLLIVAPDERKVRIEVGRGLEGVLPDAMAKLIIENAILPRFRSGDFAGGIRAGARDIALVLTGDAEEVVKARARPVAGDAENFWIAVMIFLVWSLIVFFVFYSIVRSIRSGIAPGGRSRSSRSGWSGGSSRGGGSGGSRGFSGGGGSFGGGGASGGW